MTTESTPKMTPLSKRQKIIMGIVIAILTVQFIGFFALLGSLQQIYRSINILTEFNATCVINEGNFKKKSIYKSEEQNVQNSEVPTRPYH